MFIDKHNQELHTFTQPDYRKFRIYYSVGKSVKFFIRAAKFSQAKRYAHLCQVFGIIYSVESI